MKAVAKSARALSVEKQPRKVKKSDNGKENESGASSSPGDTSAIDLSSDEHSAYETDAKKNPATRKCVKGKKPA